MFGFMKSPGKIAKQSSVDPGSIDSDVPKKGTILGRRTTSEPVLITPDFGDEKPGRPSRGTPSSYKNDFQDSVGLENQSVQELEKYAVHKAEETTNSVYNCRRIAENIKEDAGKTLDMLHQQGEQITRTHMAAADIDKDLSKGEKLLGGLGGMFSKPWKAKKTKSIDGPDLTAASAPKGASKEQREKLGISPAPKGPKSASRTPPPEASSAIQQVQAEKAKQDDALSDLSNILGDLKGMAMDMGGELEKQNKAIDHLSDDVDEINSRMKGANQRTRRLLGK